MKTAFLTSARFCAWSRSLARLQKSAAALSFRLPYCCCSFARVDQRAGLKESPESVLVEAQNWKLLLAQLGRDSSGSLCIGAGSSSPYPDPGIPCSCVHGLSILDGRDDSNVVHGELLTVVL